MSVEEAGLIKFKLSAYCRTGRQVVSGSISRLFDFSSCLIDSNLWLSYSTLQSTLCFSTPPTSSFDDLFTLLSGA